MRFARSFATASLAIGLAITGAASAQAWTWASSSSPITMTGGGGYGNANYVNYGTGNLQSWLKDTVLDGERVYVNVNGSYGQNYLNAQSGRRSDGGSSYARMADKAIYSPYPYGVSQFYYTVRICRDKPFAGDPCSDDYRTNQGL